MDRAGDSQGALSYVRGREEKEIETMIKDISRTMGRSQLYAVGGALRPALRDVMLALAASRPDHGYTQGMNQICGLLLACVRDPYTAFLCAHSLLFVRPELYAFYPHAQGARTTAMLAEHLGVVVRQALPEVHLRLCSKDSVELVAPHALWRLNG